MRVVLDHITKRFGDFTAVSEFSAVLEDGELVSLLGPSGCGKTTLMNMLSGILPVSGGKIFFDDQDVTAMPPEKRYWSGFPELCVVSAHDGHGQYLFPAGDTESAEGRAYRARQ